MEMEADSRLRGSERDGDRAYRRCGGERGLRVRRIGRGRGEVHHQLVLLRGARLRTFKSDQLPEILGLVYHEKEASSRDKANSIWSDIF